MVQHQKRARYRSPEYVALIDKGYTVLRVETIDKRRWAIMVPHIIAEAARIRARSVELRAQSNLAITNTTDQYERAVKQLTMVFGQSDDKTIHNGNNAQVIWVSDDK